MEFPGLEHDIPIYFSIANKSRKEDRNQFPVPQLDTDNKIKFERETIGKEALPKLLPEEEIRTAKEVPQKVVKKPAVKPAPKPAPTPVAAKPKKLPAVATTVDPLKPFQTGKSKVPINSLVTEKTSPASWLPKIPVTDIGADKVTLVTAYLNIGRYRNDDNKFTYTSAVFKQWMTSFCRIQNPVVVFMNDDSDLQLFGSIRSNVPNHRTAMYKISKSSLWSFSLLPNITKAYKTYPKHSPSTTVPHYTSVSFAKYEFLSIAMRENPFKTKYIAWIDIGLFRNMATPVAKIGDPLLTLYLPPMLDQKKIAYGQTNERSEDLKPSEVLRLRKYWISGSIFVGKATTMKKWILQFVKYAEEFLRNGYSGTDQYLVYAMFQTKEPLDVDIQPYTWQGHNNPMHHLAFLCRDEGARRNTLKSAKAASAIKPK